MDEKTLELIGKTRTLAQAAKSRVAGHSSAASDGTAMLADAVLTLCHALERTNRKSGDIDGGRV